MTNRTMTDGAFLPFFYAEDPRVGKEGFPSGELTTADSNQLGQSVLSEFNLSCLVCLIPPKPISPADEVIARSASSSEWDGCFYLS